MWLSRQRPSARAGYHPAGTNAGLGNFRQATLEVALLGLDVRQFDDVDGNKIEVSAEIEIIENNRLAGRWEHTERTLNLWGRGLLRQ